MVSAQQRRGFKRASRGVVPLGASLCRQMESIPQVCKMRSPVRSSPRRWFTTASERSKEHHSPGTDKHPVLHFSYSFFPHAFFTSYRSKDPTGPTCEDPITKRLSQGYRRHSTGADSTPLSASSSTPSFVLVKSPTGYISFIRKRRTLEIRKRSRSGRLRLLHAHNHRVLCFISLHNCVQAHCAVWLKDKPNH